MTGSVCMAAILLVLGQPQPGRRAPGMAAGGATKSRAASRAPRTGGAAKATVPSMPRSDRQQASRVPGAGTQAASPSAKAGQGAPSSVGAQPSQGAGAPVSQGGSGSASQGASSAQAAQPPAEDEEAAKWKPVVGSRIVTRGEIHVGDPVEIRITVVHDPKVSVNLPAALHLGEGIEVLGQGQKSTETLDDGKVREEFWVKLVPFRVGDLTPKDLEVTYTYPGPGGGAMATVKTNPGVIKVVSVMANEPNPELKPDEGPVPVMEENRTAKYILVALAALLLGALAGWLGYLLYRRRHKVAPPPPPPRPAHEIAFEKLNAISEGHLLEEGRFKEFYFAVSEAVREYLGNRFGFDSLEMTTTELLDRLKQVALVGITWDQVAEFSQDCDLVKFTKYVPDREEAEAILARAYDLVRASMLAPREAGDEAESDRQGSSPAGSEEKPSAEQTSDDESRWAPKPAQKGAGQGDEEKSSEKDTSSEKDASSGKAPSFGKDESSKDQGVGGASKDVSGESEGGAPVGAPVGTGDEEERS